MGRHGKRNMQEKKNRNSSIELLRILSMLMILGFHYVKGGNLGMWIASQPVSLKKFVYQFIYMGGGWIGNFIFFTISIWFLLERTNTLRTSLKRVWILERELLFWSLVLLAVTVVLHKQGIYQGSLGMLTLQSVFPLSLNLWWYPTSYALFLVFMPFLIKGAQALGKQHHQTLSIVLLLLWGILGLIPKFEYNLTDSSVFVFIYWFVLLSYYRWYMKDLNVRQCTYLIAAGVGIMLLYWGSTNAVFAATGKMAKAQNFIFNQWKLPTMMIGFGLFLLVQRTEFHSRIVNWIAASAFGVYLIHFQPAIYTCWTHYLGVNIMYVSKHPLVMGAAVIVGVFVACLVLDMLRQALFAITIDRHKGYGFDRTYAIIKGFIDKRRKVTSASILE